MIILINGKKRAGKDYVGERLHDILSESFRCTRGAFAGPIKEIICDTFNIAPEVLDELKNSSEFLNTRINGKKEVLTDFRKLIQNFGTEAMKKQFGDDVWVNLLVSKLYKHNINIVTDFRFMREYDVCCECDVVFTINVYNDDLCNDDMHPSETELNEFVFDAYLNNTGHRDFSEELELIIDRITEIHDDKY